MKNILLQCGITLVRTGFLAAALLNAGCRKGADSPSSTKVSGGPSAEKNSFKEVTAHLDGGGNLYAYVSTEQFLNGLSGKVNDLRQFLSGLPMQPDQAQMVERVFEAGSRIIKNSGVEQISGVGMSSIAREPGFYHSKLLLHHYKGQGNGYVWTLFGKSPHPFGTLDFLPQTTALAMFFDGDIAQGWSVLKSELSQIGVPEAEQAMSQLPVQFERVTGVPLDQLLGSFGGEYGMVLTLDDSKKISLPMGPTPVELPEPALMLVFKVKDDTIFNRIEKLMTENPKQASSIVRVDKGGVRMRTLPLPLPLPLTVRPTLARHGDYLFIATSDTLVNEAISAKKGEKKGWKSSDEFKKLSKGIPDKGNSYQFVSVRLGQTVARIQQKALESNNQLKPGQAEMMQRLLAGQGGFSSFTVAANTDEGWIVTGNGSQSMNATVLLPALAMPVALLAGVAAPKFMKARQGAAANSAHDSIVNNLRMLENAKEQWALENKKAEGATVVDSDLSDYLQGGKINPVAGEIYQLNPVGTPPSATVPVPMNGRPAGSIITAND